MKVEFYRTRFCPRCLLAARALEALRREFADLEIEPIEILSNLDRARQAGIRSVPALRLGGHLLTGLFLSQERIRAFLRQYLPTP